MKIKILEPFGQLAALNFAKFLFYTLHILKMKALFVISKALEIEQTRKAEKLADKEEQQRLEREKEERARKERQEEGFQCLKREGILYSFQ